MRSVTKSQRTRRARITPPAVAVLTANAAFATRNTVVVPEILIRTVGTVIVVPFPFDVNGIPIPAKVPSAPNVAEVVLVPTVMIVTVVVLAGEMLTTPPTSQSPAVRLILVTFEVTPVPRETLPSAAVAVISSPTLPALALLFVVVPTMPFVCDGVKLPVADRVVNAPVEGVDPPMAAPSIVPPVIVGLFPNAGSAPVTPKSICPVVPTTVWLMAAVPSPTSTP